MDDCNDANASLFQSLTVRADADADSYCTGPSVVQCTGAVPSSGYRVASSCASTDDCNDGNANVFKVYPVRTDADGDGYCVGAVTNQCAGNAPLAGTRLASSCQAIDDCKDTNPNATSTCIIAGGYQTTSATKQCGIGFAPTEGKVVAVVQGCPVGFTLTTSNTVYSGTAGGTCTVATPTSTTMSCASLVFGSFSCSIAGDCVAN